MLGCTYPMVRTSALHQCELPLFMCYKTKYVTALWRLILPLVKFYNSWHFCHVCESVSQNKHFYAPRKISGEHIVAVVSVRPSGLISPKPFIINWYNLPQMFLVTKACDPRLSRSFWKGQGHSELINIPYFNSFLTYKFTPPNPFIIDSS